MKPFFFCLASVLTAQVVLAQGTPVQRVGQCPTGTYTSGRRLRADWGQPGVLQRWLQLPRGLDPFQELLRKVTVSLTMTDGLPSFGAVGFDV
jgi:hypothetical protein